MSSVNPSLSMESPFYFLDSGVAEQLHNLQPNERNKLLTDCVNATSVNMFPTNSESGIIKSGNR